MKLTIAAKLIISSFLLFSGVVSSKIRKTSNGNFLVLMYHRILPGRETIGVQAGMYVEPETLKKHLKFLNKNFEVVTLSQLFCTYIEDKVPSGNPLCAITFDDGWYDFYRYAYPVIKEYNTPATVFLPTGYIGSKRWFWTDRLSNILMKVERSKKTNQSSHNPVVEQIEKLNGSFESRLESAIAMLKAFRADKIDSILSELSEKWYPDMKAPERAFLSWNEVKEMAKSGLVSFGSHTVNHPILTTLNDDEIIQELSVSREKLLAESVVDPKFVPFCYPNGDYDNEIVKMMSDVGYQMAVTTKNGWNRSNTDDIRTLKRVAIHQDMSSTTAMFGCKVSCIF